MGLSRGLIQKPQIGQDKMRRVNRKKGRLSAPELLLFLLVGTVGLILVLGGLFSGAEAHNENVKTGQVKVTKYIDKVCDNNNLIYTYTGEGIAVSPNDPQCN